MGKTTSYYDLRDALALPGCPVCRLTADAVRRHLDGLLWECVNDAGVRRDIRLARGFCQQHAWLLVEKGSTLGAVIIVRDVMKTVARTLDAARFQPPPMSVLRRAQEAFFQRPATPANEHLVASLGPQARCPVCVQAERTESALITTIVDCLKDDDGVLDALRASDGLCLHHLRLTLTRVHDDAAFRALVAVHTAIWEKLVGQLDEIVRKEDYRFRNEPRGEETGASLRAIAVIAGPRIEVPPPPRAGHKPADGRQ